MKKLPFLKKKLNVLKNQQALIEMLITVDKCRNEWRVVKNDKSKKNTNKTSAYSIPSKVPSSVNLKNRFSSLMVTEERSIETESQVKRQLIVISVSKFKTQNLNQELKKPNPAVYELR